jgi:DNA integrity scanning protein DisA with diadenylate cyclase activity
MKINSEAVGLSDIFFEYNFDCFFDQILVVLPEGKNIHDYSKDKRLNKHNIMTSLEYKKAKEYKNIVMGPEGYEDFEYTIFGKMVVHLEELITVRDVKNFCLKKALEVLKKIEDISDETSKKSLRKQIPVCLLEVQEWI